MLAHTQFFLSLTHTHTLSLSFSHSSHTQSLFLSLILTHSYSFSQSLTHSKSLFLSLTHTNKQTHTHTHTPIVHVFNFTVSALRFVSILRTLNSSLICCLISLQFLIHARTHPLSHAHTQLAHHVQWIEIYAAARALFLDFMWRLYTREY